MRRQLRREGGGGGARAPGAVARLIVAGLWLFVAAWGLVAYLHVIRWPPDLLNLAALIGLLLLWWIGLHAAYFVVFVGGGGQETPQRLAAVALVGGGGVPAAPGRGGRPRG